MNVDHQLVLETFGAEAEEQLALLEEGIVQLERTGHAPDLAESLFRAAHTLKGNASLVGAQEVVSLANDLETSLEAIVQGRVAMSRELGTRLLAVIDELRKVLPGALDDASVPAATGAEARTVRVPITRLDKMLDVLGELTIARERMTGLLAARASTDELEDAQRDTDQLYLELQDQLMKARMVSIGPLFRQHRRTVRDLALAHGKQAQLELEGEDVEVDAAVMEALRDPLVHLVRNAIDHGLEAPAERSARGKPATGRLRLRASYAGGRVVIELSDDGRGLDAEKILARARAQGLVAAEATPDERAIHHLIFVPGFSTAEQVNELSGRGVGMDVVRRNVENLRGTIEVTTQPGEGTTFRLALPLTLAIIESLSVGVGGDTYVLPLESVVECVDLPAGSDVRAETGGILDLRGSPLPFVRLRSLFEMAPAAGGRESVVVVRHGESVAGLAVDALHGEGQTVIRPLPRLADGQAGVSGTALLGNGHVALILDVPQLLSRIKQGAGAPP